MITPELSAEAHIKMDGTLTFQPTFRGSPLLLIPMIGAVDFLKDWMKDEVRRVQTASPVSAPARGGLCSNTEANSLEVEVQRDVALALYWNAMEKMRERLIAIDKAAPYATFHIDPSLLKNL